MVSIILASYNGEQFISEQIDSILNQDYREFELLIFDDCSTDATIDIISCKKDDRIKIYKNSERLGYAKNFLQGIKKCRGDYIFFSDQDDIWFNNKLSTTLQLIKNVKSTVNLFITNEIKFSDSSLLNTSLYKQRKTKALNFKQLVNYCSYQGCNMCISKEFGNKLSFDKDTFIKGHDWYISVMAGIEGGVFYNETPLMFHRIHVGSTTREKEYNKLQFKKMVLSRQLDSLIWGKSFFIKDLISNNLLWQYKKIENLVFLKYQFLVTDKKKIRYFLLSVFQCFLLFISPKSIFNLVYLRIRYGRNNNG